MLELCFLVLWLGIAIGFKDPTVFFFLFVASLMVYRLLHETLVMLGWRGRGE